MTSCHLTSGNKLTKVFNTTAVNLQLPTFDYVKPSADELALEEMKALNTTDNNCTDGHAQQQPVQHPQKQSVTFNDIDYKNVGQASFFMQYLLLLQRILVCSKRNYVSTT